MPTRIITGDGCLVKGSSYLSGLGKKALIITGKNSSKMNGSLDDAIEALENEKIRYKIFDKVGEHPSVELIQEIYDRFRDEGIEFILALGGGAPIDASKAAGVLFRNREISAAEAFSMKNLRSIPIAAVPTTAGTGSEVTPYSIITDSSMRQKKDFGQESFPKVAYLDSRYTYYISRENTANNAVDALSHLVEGVLNKRATLFSDTLAMRGLALFSEVKDHLMNGNLTAEDRKKLITASTLGGMVISQTGTSIPHALGYILTTDKELPHGSATAAIYRGYLRLFNNDSRYQAVLKTLGFSSSDEFTGFISDLTDYDLSLTEEEIRSYTNASLNNLGKMKNHPYTIRKEDIEEIYRVASLKKSAVR